MVFFNLTPPEPCKSGLSKTSPDTVVTWSLGTQSPPLQPMISKALRVHLCQSTPWYPLLSPSHSVNSGPADTGFHMSGPCSNAPSLASLPGQGPSYKGLRTPEFWERVCQDSWALPTSPAPEPALFLSSLPPPICSQ